MKRSNTAILLILRDHMIPYRVTDGVPQIQVKDSTLLSATSAPPEAWVNVPDIISAMHVVGGLST